MLRNGGLHACTVCHKPDSVSASMLGDFLDFAWRFPDPFLREPEVWADIVPARYQ